MRGLLLGAFTFVMTMGISSTSHALDLEGSIIVQNVGQVTVGVGGTFNLNAEKVSFRTSDGQVMEYGKFSVQVTGGAKVPGCVELALKATDSGRFSIRVKNLNLSSGAVVSDRILVPADALASCTFLNR
jgi:hypothetical protein